MVNGLDNVAVVTWGRPAEGFFRLPGLYDGNALTMGQNNTSECTTTPHLTFLVGWGVVVLVAAP